MNFDLNNNGIEKWYAVQRTSEDDWGYGSFDMDEAKKLLREQGYGLIAVIDNINKVCLEEIPFDELD